MRRCTSRVSRGAARPAPATAPAAPRTVGTVETGRLPAAANWAKHGFDAPSGARVLGHGTATAPDPAAVGGSHTHEPRVRVRNSAHFGVLAAPGGVLSAAKLRGYGLYRKAVEKTPVKAESNCLLKSLKMERSTSETRMPNFIM